MSFDESEIYHDMPTFCTMSNPNRPGLAVLEFRDEDGIVMFSEVFDKAEWDRIDRAMRSSLGKYSK
jgi:hypothetical protein